MNTLQIFGSIISFVGAIFCIIAFLIVQKKDFSKLLYNVVNLCAALCLLTSLLVFPNPGMIVLEIIYTGIAIVCIIKEIKKKRNNTNNNQA